MKWFWFLGLVILQSSFAGENISTAKMTSYFETVPSAQLQRYQEVAYPEYRSSLTFSNLYTPYYKINPLETSWGEYYGYPYRQRFQISLLEDIPKLGKAGLVYFYERSGWEREDFLFFRPDLNPGYGQSSHLYGASWRDSTYSLAFSGGGISQRALNESGIYHQKKPQGQHYWGAVTYDVFSFNFLKSPNIQNYKMSLEFEKKETRPGAFLAISPFMPNISYAWDDQTGWNQIQVYQNLYDQVIYGKFNQFRHDFQIVTFDLFALKGNFFKLSCSIPIEEHKIKSPGFEIELAVLRLAYNQVDDYQTFIKGKNQWAIELVLDVAKIGIDKVFAPGSATYAQFETDIKKNIYLPRRKGMGE